MSTKIPASIKTPFIFALQIYTKKMIYNSHTPQIDKPQTYKNTYSQINTEFFHTKSELSNNLNTFSSILVLKKVMSLV